MAITLKEETILDQWSTMIEGAAGHAGAVMDSIQGRLDAARIPGECTWSLEEVKSSGWFSKTRREFLVIKLGQFSDYRLYASARDYGVYLDVCWFLTVEPGRFKKMMAEKVSGGFGDALSAPKNVLVEQDLRAWATAVHHAIRGAVETLMNELGQDASKLRRQSKGILEVW